MAAGVTDRLWEVSDLVALLEADERVEKSGVSDMIGPMRVCRLVLAFGCLISSEAWGVDKPILLKLEESTTLRVGELAVLQIPADHIRSHFSGAGNALVLVRHSRRTAYIVPSVPEMKQSF